MVSHCSHCSRSLSLLFYLPLLFFFILLSDNASGKLKHFRWVAFFMWGEPDKELPKLFFAVYWFFILQNLFSFLFGNFVSSFNASLWLCLKIRGQDNSPTHHFLRERVEPRQENTEQGPLPCAPCLGSATHNLPLCGLSPSLKNKKDRKRQS